MAKSFALLALAMIWSAANARAVDCQSEKGPGSPWAWRQIDGKQCWYKGERGMDKKLLRWPETVETSAETAKRAPTVVNEDADEHETLLHSYWPPLR